MTSTTLDALKLHLIRTIDECSSVVSDKSRALFALAELAFIEGKQAGGASSAVIGMKRVAEEMERETEELHERVDEALDMARALSRGADEPEPEEGPERATVAGVIDEMRGLHRETVDLVRDLAGRVAKLEAERAPEPAA